MENLSALGVVERVKKTVIVDSERPKRDGTPKTVQTTKDLYRLSNKYRGYCESVGGV